MAAGVIVKVTVTGVEPELIMVPVGLVVPLVGMVPAILPGMVLLQV